MSLSNSPASLLFRALSSGALLFGLVACGTSQIVTVQPASAELQPTRGNTASGRVEFAEVDGRVTVTGEIRGLKPNAEHGFHVHEKGDCSSGDGMSAGGHFNPAASAHGRHGQGAHHVGDLPSLKADANGVARVMFESTSLTLKPGASSILDKGLIVHRDPDDYTTQPTGNSGPRVACGVIRKS